MGKGAWVISGIYRITSPDGHMYIGKSIDVYKRWAGYKKLRFKSQPYLAWSLAEYGVENHIFEILEEAPASKLLELENKYIKMFRTIGTVHGLNVNGTNPTKLDYSDKVNIDELKKKVDQSGKRIDAVINKIKLIDIAWINIENFNFSHEKYYNLKYASKWLSDRKYNVGKVNEDVPIAAISLSHSNIIDVEDMDAEDLKSIDGVVYSENWERLGITILQFKYKNRKDV